MASNSFGTIFRITTWGESHGKAMGVVIDGCPAGLEISESIINAELALRAPGKSLHTSARREKDEAEILSGVFEGKTTGAPLSILIPNCDAKSEAYDPLKNLLRPGHANYTYLEKYGIFDYRGSGRASARETVSRVAAGAVAKVFLASHDIHLLAYIKQIGSCIASIPEESLMHLGEKSRKSAVFCPDSKATEAMLEALTVAKDEGDSLGGVIEFQTSHLPVGLGDPVYEKLNARLAYALLSIPATKGFEMGEGFAAASFSGSAHNDLFIQEQGKVSLATNHAGGTLGGISTGEPLSGRVVFKPASSIFKPQETLTTEGEKAVLQLPSTSRHDPCVAIRAVPVVEAMVALVLADAILLNRSAQA